MKSKKFTFFPRAKQIDSKVVMEFPIQEHLGNTNTEHESGRVLPDKHRSNPYAGHTENTVLGPGERK